MEQILGRSPDFAWKTPLNFSTTGNRQWKENKWTGLNLNGGTAEIVANDPLFGTAYKYIVTSSSIKPTRVYPAIYTTERIHGECRVKLFFLYDSTFNVKGFNVFGVFNSHPDMPDLGHDYSILANVDIRSDGHFQLVTLNPHSGTPYKIFDGKVRVGPNQKIDLELRYDGNMGLSLLVNGNVDVTGGLPPAYNDPQYQDMKGVIGGHAGAYTNDPVVGSYIINSQMSFDCWVNDRQK